MKKSGPLLTSLLAFWVILCVVSDSFSQNIVPNPSFEVYTLCPTGPGQGGVLPCDPWSNATQGTCDYFNACASIPSGVTVPPNFRGFQYAQTGFAYAGLYARTEGFLYREYLRVQLTTPMVADSTYDVNFWVSLGEQTCGTKNMGAYFSVPQPFIPTLGVFNATPQVSASIGFINDTLNWTLISGCYTALGGEQWMVIGNFLGDAASPIDPACALGHTSYYYIEDVSVVLGDPPGTIDFDLGGPITECNFYQIDPGLGNVGYHWEGGSSGPTLTVFESGTYSLTVTEGCDIGVDSIEVTILGTFDPVEIGPPSATICNGDSYDITLDPNAGDYVWQDGSTDPDYSITTSGVYSVSLDDGCDITTDEITVTVLDPPAPFTLGSDTHLCPGEDNVLSFDPSLGNFLWQDNSTSPGYTISSGGIYQLTISNMCGEFSDELVVTDIIPPSLEFDPQLIELCPNQDVEFDFDPAAGDYLWQDGSTSPFYTISDPGVYSLTITNECGNTSDQVSAILVEEPVFDLGPDIVACPAQLPITLDVSNATNAVSFLWQNGSTDSDIEVNGAGIYSVTVSNSCFSITDEIEVEIQDATPLVTLPPDQILCPGETITLSVNGLSGNYVWQDGSTSSTFLVTQPGNYSLTVTTDCGSGADNISVQYNSPLLAPDLGPDVTLCPGEQYIFYAHIPGVSYTWQDQSTADSLIVTTPGMYTLQISNACSSASDTVMVNINASPPQLDLPSSLSLCQFDTILVDAGISGVQFLWNDGSQSPTLSVVSPGMYSLTVSNACGADADTITIIDAGPAPSVSLGQDISFCMGDTLLLTPVSSDVISWLWQDGSSSSTFDVSSPGLVTVQVNNNCGVSYDTLMSSLLPSIPPLQLGADTSLCPGQSLTLSISSPGVNILWSDGSANNNFNVVSPGVVYATITNACGVSSDSVDITYLPSAPSLDLGADQSVCPGDVITLSPGINGVSYLWQDGSTGSSFSTSQAQSVILTISNSCGSESDTIEIIENLNGPQVDLGPDILACEGSVVTLNSGILGVNYLWQDGSTNSDFTTSVSGTYILQVSNSCGTDADTVDVDISGVAPTADLGADTLLCEGQSIQLLANADPGTMVMWQDGSTSPVYNVTTSGIYFLSATNLCGFASDTIDVNYESPPVEFNLGPDTILCPGQSIVLTSPQTNVNITWQDGSHATSITADQQQLYSLQLSNSCGITSDSLNVHIDDRSPAVHIDSTISWCEGDVITLDATQSFVADYLWSTGAVTPAIQVNSSGTYEVNVITDCQSVLQDIEIVPGDNCNHEFYIPTVFSPNEDNVNDFFTISFSSQIQIVTLDCSIFDRWGNLVYNTHDPSFAWNGHFKNEPLNPGVYVYRALFTYTFGGKIFSEMVTGDITLVR
ncbi:MAG: gliding motility-associated C-terminal domain-containing protein [Saprospiraceae bacterium]